jgi:hypothetical protein
MNWVVTMDVDGRCYLQQLELEAGGVIPTIGRAQSKAFRFRARDLARRAARAVAPMFEPRVVRLVPKKGAAS